MKPLDGLFVVDLSRILSGPVCTMLLADMGAEVIKIEPPPLGDDSRQWGPPFIGGISTYFLSVNRNKKSLGLNLKTEEGRRILWKLIERADVVIENFRPGVLAKLGFGYEAVSKANRRAVYCSISGFGHTGPYRNRPGYDVIAQGESGLMDLTGFPDGPPPSWALPWPILLPVCTHSREYCWRFLRVIEPARGSTSMSAYLTVWCRH